MFVLVFPGQGSQRPGMGRAWVDHPSWALVAELSDVVGRDLAELLLDAGPETLRATRNAQMATFTLSAVALHAALRGPLARRGPGTADSAPDMLSPPSGLVAVAGHSLGEYTALVAAGALGLHQGARLVHARGEAMQGAAEATSGTMAAVLGLELAEIAAACTEGEGTWVANDNTARQVVIAGTAAGVEETSARLLKQGAKRVMALQVGGAFHTPLMAPAQARLDAALQATPFSPSSRPLVANLDARAHSDGFPALLSSQLCSPVRWRECLLALAGMGAKLFIELGPGTELSRMVRRTVPEAARTNVAGPEDLGVLEGALAAS
ncbi:MAG: ACP S-malonyltransferase [Acidimicrobiales bacterium]